MGFYQKTNYIADRLAKNRKLSGKQYTFNTGVLPHGIYIVQARLKEGEVQRGKLVVK